MRQRAWERGSRLSETLPPPKALPLEPCSWVRAEVSLVGSARRGAEWAQAVSGRLRPYQGSSAASHAPFPNFSLREMGREGLGTEALGAGITVYRMTTGKGWAGRGLSCDDWEPPSWFRTPEPRASIVGVWPEQDCGGTHEPDPKPVS